MCILLDAKVHTCGHFAPLWRISGHFAQWCGTLISGSLVVQYLKPSCTFLDAKTYFMGFRIVSLRIKIGDCERPI